VGWRRIGAPAGAGRATHLFGASHVLARLFACALFHRVASNLVKSSNFYASPPLFARVGLGRGELHLTRMAARGAAEQRFVVIH
jgi:hypothetical protein